MCIAANLQRGGGLAADGDSEQPPVAAEDAVRLAAARRHHDARYVMSYSLSPWNR